MENTGLENMWKAYCMHIQNKHLHLQWRLKPEKDQETGLRLNWRE